MNPKLLELWNKMSPLQQGVVQALEQGYPPREAYKRGGGSSTNLKSIDAMVCGLLTSSNVVAYRNALAGEKINPMIMSREEMRLRLTNLARANLTDVARVTKVLMGYDDDGLPIYVNRVEIEDFNDVPDETLAGLSEVAQKKDGISLKMKDSIAAMKLLAELDGHQKPAQVEIRGFGNTAVSITSTDPAEAAVQYQELMR